MLWRQSLANANRLLQKKSEQKFFNGIESVRNSRKYYRFSTSFSLNHSGRYHTCERWADSHRKRPVSSDKMKNTVAELKKNPTCKHRVTDSMLRKIWLAKKIICVRNSPVPKNESGGYERDEEVRMMGRKKGQRWQFRDASCMCQKA